MPDGSLVSTQESPNHKRKFQIYVLIGLIVVLVIVVVLDVLSFMGKIDLKGEDNETAKSSIVESASKNSMESSNKSGKTWNDCKVLADENSYLPDKLGKEFTNDFVGLDGSSGNLAQYIKTVTKDDLTFLLFAVQVRKESAGEDGDINAMWKFYNTDVKEAVDAEGGYIATKTLYGNESLIISGTVQNGETGQEEIQTSVTTLIPSHNMLVTITVPVNNNEVEDYYEKWFNASCQPK